MAALSRSSLQILAEEKAADARLLFEHGRYSNSYYLCGYAVELGLKACIARKIVPETVPDTTILRGFLDHNFGRLVGLAGLSKQLEIDRLNSDFDSRWAVVSEWSVDVRYDIMDADTASAMQDAVEHHKHGVLQWLRRHW